VAVPANGDFTPPVRAARVNLARDTLAEDGKVPRAAVAHEFIADPVGTTAL